VRPRRRSRARERYQRRIHESRAGRPDATAKSYTRDDDDTARTGALDRIVCDLPRARNRLTSLYLFLSLSRFRHIRRVNKIAVVIARARARAPQPPPLWENVLTLGVKRELCRAIARVRTCASGTVHSPRERGRVRG